MRWTSLITLFGLATCTGQTRIGPIKVPGSSPPTASSPMGDFFDLRATDIHGDTVSMDRYRGHKVLVVNTASECGNTPQYTQLEHLYEQYRDRGLVIIGFPCDQFGRQEPGTEAQIEAFCTKNYGVTFPMMSKVEVKGPGKHPVYQWLTERRYNGKLDAEITWNFQKFLIDEQGQLVTTVAPGTDPTTEVIMNWLEDKK